MNGAIKRGSPTTFGPDCSYLALDSVALSCINQVPFLESRKH